MRHELKILPVYLKAVLSGDKTFEIRHNDDRGFQKGDEVLLCEYNSGHFTGPKILVEITYVTAFKQAEGYVVFGFKIA